MLRYSKPEVETNTDIRYQLWFSTNETCIDTTRFLDSTSVVVQPLVEHNAVAPHEQVLARDPRERLVAALDMMILPSSMFKDAVTA